MSACHPLLLLLASSLVGIALAQTCDGITECLQEDEQDCLARGYRCAEGLFCWDNGANPRVGTCRRSALVGEACSNVHTRGANYVRCWDPKYRGSVFCEDVLSNGTCVYGSLYASGESCKLDSLHDEFGGCLSGACVGGRCTSLAVNASCQANGATQGECAPGLYCASTNECKTRKAQGGACEANIDCDYNLVCTAKGSNGQRTCVPLFNSAVGEGCDTNFDCSANLFCSASECAEVFAFSNDACNDTADCNTGWNCKCKQEIDGDTLVDKGGRCTESMANTKEQIDGFRALQSCLKTKGCQDYWWRVAYALGATVQGADQCWAECIAGSGYNGFDSPPYEEGKCFSAATALTPSSGAVSLAVLLAILAAFAQLR